MISIKKSFCHWLWYRLSHCFLLNLCSGEILWICLHKNEAELTQETVTIYDIYNNISIFKWKLFFYILHRWTNENPKLGLKYGSDAYGNEEKKRQVDDEIAAITTEYWICWTINVECRRI